MEYSDHRPFFSILNLHQQAEEVAIRNIIACGQIGVAESSSSIHHHHHHHHRIIKQNKKERIHIKIVDKGEEEKDESRPDGILS